MSTRPKRSAKPIERLGKFEGEEAPADRADRAAGEPEADDSSDDEPQAAPRARAKPRAKKEPTKPAENLSGASRRVVARATARHLTHTNRRARPQTS